MCRFLIVYCEVSWTLRLGVGFGEAICRYLFIVEIGSGRCRVSSKQASQLSASNESFADLQI